MGAWGIGTFDNDGACDWVYDLEETTDLSLLESTLAPDNPDPEGDLILAAAEVVYALHKTPRNTLPEDVQGWIEKHRDLDVTHLLPKAVAAIDQVLNEDCDLYDCWKEADDFAVWEKDVKELQFKLKV